MFDVNAVEVYLLGRKLMKIAESAFVADQRHGGGLPTSVRMVLVDISVHPGSSIGEIAARSGFPQSHVSASVARLREAGVLETSIDPGDGRRTLVRLAADFGERFGRRPPVPVDAALAAELPSADPERLAQTIEALEALARGIIPQALRRTRAAPAARFEAG
jgi:DNA-binding MarR family transcriptional regulator